MKFNYMEIEDKIQYKFREKKLLKHALIHRSYGNENWEYKTINYERLELLGDAVLDLVVTEYLYKHFEDHTEGELAKLKAMAVSEPVLAKISTKLELGKYFLLSKGEELTGGRNRPSILGDVFEAILGAIYLDSDFETAKKIGLIHLKEEVRNIEKNEELIDFKTILQEFSQKIFKEVPIYEVLEEVGPDHNKVFKIGVVIDSKIVGEGQGKNKKAAEQEAAKNACKGLNISNEKV